ncbi:MAG: carbon starvation protein A [Phycisphaerae bacterium]|nr:carbon starvation protein A [Phycisphaerae bacterium]
MSILTNSVFIAILSAVGFVLAYRLYGRYLARRIFGFDASRPTPAHRFRDGMDYVPTHPAILFGHHFSSIAGLGPIVGPAIAVLWGWVPALLWVVFGSIFMGAVHDLATLYASMRHDGRGIGDLTRDVLGARPRVLFLVIIFFLLALAMGVFALLMAQLFTDLSPQAVVPTMALILIAVVMGVLVYVRRWNLGVVTLLGLGLMFGSMYIGMKVPVPLYKQFLDSEIRQALDDAPRPQVPMVGGVRAAFPAEAIAYFESHPKHTRAAGWADDVREAQLQAKDTWTYTLLLYAFIASILPVWLLLQPRDYINSYQLYAGLLALMAGVFALRPVMSAPAARMPDWWNQPIWPFLFITIACGAISGFHNLVSSGTTARQLRNEGDATAVGYGSMLTEAFLAVLVILACCAGLSAERYGALYNAGFTENMALGAFLEGAANLIAAPFLWMSASPTVDEAAVKLAARSFIAVVIVSFAMTTLDSGTRLLRYNVETIGKLVRLPLLCNRYVAAVIAVVAIGAVALLRINGQPAGLALWQLFGTTNQLLAAIGLLVVSVMLFIMRKPIVYTLVPMLLMLVMVSWAMVFKLRDYYGRWHASGDAGYRALFLVGSVIAVLTVWLMIEAVIVFARQWRNRSLPGVAAK